MRRGGDEAAFGDRLPFQRVEGGLFLWAALPDGVDMPDFCRRAVQHKVAVVPGSAFLTDEAAPCQAVRLNFSTPTDEQITRGVALLSEVARGLF